MKLLWKIFAKNEHKLPYWLPTEKVWGSESYWEAVAEKRRLEWIAENPTPTYDSKKAQQCIRRLSEISTECCCC
jgi:hypothetical protein